jgi:5-(carboxyamino)imidazole ribonucleotide synthase
MLSLRLLTWEEASLSGAGPLAGVEAARPGMVRPHERPRRLRRVTDAADGRPPVPTVGMVGAGQLARMTCQAAIGLGIRFRVLADSAADSAAQVCPDVQVGDYTCLDDLLAFAGGCDVVTFDHEHVPGRHLAALEQAVAVRPGAGALRYTQDKLAMRERLAGLGVPCPRYAPVPGEAGLAGVTAFAADAGWPVVLKAVSGGYDGRGVWVCGTPDEVAEVLAHPVAVFAEEHIDFDRELAVLAARSPQGQAAVYPVVQTVQRDGVCHEVLAPAPWLAAGRAREAQRLALGLAATLEVTGLLAVELFETPRGLLVNELAMRPHNSGHWTIEGARTSQFEQHLRAVLDLPLGAPAAAAPQIVMANVFGGQDPDVYERYLHVMAADPGVKLHLYGKDVRPGRKIGHVTALGDDVDELRARAGRAARYLATGKD